MKLKHLILPTALCLTAPLFGAVVEHIGTGLDWSANWIALPGLNDPADAGEAGQVDFVGNASNAGAYWASDGTYIFFRFQVNSPAASATFDDTHTVLIDVDNYLYGSGFGSDSASLQPDFAFTWDSKSGDVGGHGLEMSVIGDIGTTWGKTKLADLDGINGKTAVDINGDIAGRGYDGYVRSLDATASTTFVDFAVEWSYLEAYTDLEKGQSWSIALASIDGVNDHNFLSADIAGGATPSSALSSGWTTIGVVPEPTVIGLISVSGLLLLIGKRFIGNS